MYEELDTFERALQHFGTRVEVIAAMEMGNRISAEDAYQMIKDELKELKKGSEIMEERSRVTEATPKIGRIFGTLLKNLVPGMLATLRMYGTKWNKLNH